MYRPSLDWAAGLASPDLPWGCIAGTIATSVSRGSSPGRCDQRSCRRPRRNRRRSDCAGPSLRCPICATQHYMLNDSHPHRDITRLNCRIMPAAAVYNCSGAIRKGWYHCTLADLRPPVSQSRSCSRSRRACSTSRYARHTLPIIYSGSLHVPT